MFMNFTSSFSPASLRPSMRTRHALTSRTKGRRPLGGFLSSPPRCECLLGFRWAFAAEVWVIFGDPGGFGVPLWIRGGLEGLGQTARNFRTSLTLRGANSFLRFAAGATACGRRRRCRRCRRRRLCCCRRRRPCRRRRRRHRPSPSPAASPLPLSPPRRRRHRCRRRALARGDEPKIPHQGD